jgi:hypothetical protein
VYQDLELSSFKNGSKYKNRSKTVVKAIVTRVGTYVQRGSKFCLLVLVTTLSSQNTAFYTNFTMLSGAQLIATLHAALPGSLARQPCINITSSITGPSLGRQNWKLFYGRHAALHYFTVQRPAV